MKLSSGLGIVVVGAGHGNGVVGGFGAGVGGGAVGLGGELGHGAEGGGGGGNAAGGSAGGEAGGRAGRAAGIGLGEEAVTGDGEGADDQDADEPDHDGDEDGHDLDQGSLGDDAAAEGLMVDQGDGDTPPGEGGVHGSRQQPGAEEVPDFLRLIGALFWGEEAGDAGEVDTAEGDGKDGGPAERGEAQVTEQVIEGEIGGGVVEDLEGEKGGDDEQAEEHAAGGGDSRRQTGEGESR
jgi:hypothetical protein